MVELAQGGSVINEATTSSIYVDQDDQKVQPYTSMAEDCVVLRVILYHQQNLFKKKKIREEIIFLNIFVSLQKFRRRKKFKKFWPLLVGQKIQKSKLSKKIILKKISENTISNG